MPAAFPWQVFQSSLSSSGAVPRRWGAPGAPELGWGCGLRKTKSHLNKLRWAVGLGMCAFPEQRNSDRRNPCSVSYRKCFFMFSKEEKPQMIFSHFKIKGDNQGTPLVQCRKSYCSQTLCICSSSKMRVRVVGSQPPNLFSLVFQHPLKPR